MMKIPLSAGKYAIVDDQDYRFLSQWKWSFHNGGYACRRQHISSSRKHQLSKMILMHRLIMDATEDKEVDHINGDRLDNRRSNLRLCTRVENTRNLAIRKTSKSGYKGVTWYKAYQQWQANISANKRTHFLGYFENKDAAARAYNAAALSLHGEFARLNKVT